VSEKVKNYDAGVNAINSSISLLVPVRGHTELQRVNYFADAVVSSWSWGFDVGGTASLDMTLDTDNRSIFYDDRKVVDVVSYIVQEIPDADDESTNEIEVGLGAAANNGIGVEFTEIFKVYINGEEVNEVDTAAELRKPCDSGEKPNWFHNTSDSPDTVEFNPGSIRELDCVQFVGDPVSDPTWTGDYQLTSQPGDQGGLFKGELNIKLITDTARPRVIEGFTIEAANAGNDNVVIINTGTVYLKNPRTNNLEIVKVYETTYHTMTVGSERNAVQVSGNPTFESTLLTLEMENDSIKVVEINALDDLASFTDDLVVIGAVFTTQTGVPGFVTEVFDYRECHVHRMSLIQSATLGAALDRETVEELGNEDNVEMSLNKPITVTTDVTAKDADEELLVLTHDADGGKLIVENTNPVATNIIYTDNTLEDITSPSEFSDLTGGDILVVRGSKGIVESVSGDIVTLKGRWFGETPIDGTPYAIHNGVLESRRMEDNIGIQVNLFTSDDREEGEKTIIIETIRARPSSDGVSIAVGGDGELSFSLTSDNLRAFAVA